jgi:serine/threonine-protein kinase
VSTSDDPRREQLHRAVLAVGRDRGPWIWRSLSATLDSYVARWGSMYRETCEATHVRGEQSAEVLDLRMSCLSERLASVGALVDVLASADSAVVDNAIGAADTLPSLDRCSDVPLLRAVVRPPDDPIMRSQVAKLREDVARVNVLAAAGRCDRGLAVGRPLQAAARQIGYKPLEAEASLALGRMYDSCLDIGEGLADLEDAVMAAEASRHDEVAIEACANLGVAYAERAHDLRAGRDWLRLGYAILARFPDHPLLEARLAASRSALLMRQGLSEPALREAQRAGAIFERLLGPSNVDVAMSANNAANALHELGRDLEAEESIRRARTIIGDVVGEDTGRFALALVNESEILIALGRFDEARANIARGVRIWTSQAANPFFLGFGLLNQGRLELAERHPAAATKTLERAVASLGSEPTVLKAEAEFLLARALVASSSNAATKAADLAHQARMVLADDPAATRVVREIDAWQRSAVRSSPNTVH